MYYIVSTAVDEYMARQYNGQFEVWEGGQWRLDVCGEIAEMCQGKYATKFETWGDLELWAET